MRRSKIFLIALLALLPNLLIGQDTIRLSDLYAQMEHWSKIYRISSANDSVFSYKKANIKSNYLPSLDFNAEATWQSDVTSIDIPVPNISVPSPDKDNYKVTVDVTQLIWDGGATRSKINLEEKAHLIDQIKVESEIYGLKEKVSKLYFGLISIDIALEQLKVMAGVLDNRIDELTASVKAGVVLESSLNMLKAERLRLEQSIDANRAQRSQIVSTIYSLTGAKIDTNDVVVVPNLPIPNQDGCLRPDYKLFDLQSTYLSAANQALNAKRLPKLAAFARAGYGKPALNMLSNEFNTFAIVGARLSWNIWDWNSTSRERQTLKIQQNIVNYRKATYNDNCSAQIDASLEQINSLDKQIQKDEQIVQLLEKAVRESASQLKNGAITSSSYISDFNSLLRAKIEMNLRNVKRSQEVVNLYFILGLSVNE
ncbi:TolC family protein [Tenuifilum thalassicum]|uniref:TolC family protein n=1 Tax=Tenuifilum thalassicum TaxID=2590900 RepID=A0A7D3XKX5_9BACT|nr:TolC family protein [Tenuifilum thalassicum]QKG79915.1 TolC family protein [Tenuifilum thalassicum]